MNTSPLSTIQLRLGDCVEEMAKMPADSVDAIVTDPPYGLKFMGKRWDDPGTFFERRPDPSVKFDNVGGNHNPCNPQDQARTARVENQRQQEWHEAWAREALRVLKPGGYLLAFGGTRTAHRMVCAIEDAGFEIRDSLHWVYGSGFPKSLDVSKAIDKMAGAEREVVGAGPYDTRRPASRRVKDDGETIDWHYGNGDVRTAPATEEAQQWQGWGTALKPAHEPICVARKPLSGKNVAQNVLKHGTGAINVDATRVGTDQISQHGRKAKEGTGWGEHWHNDLESGKTWTGRWPPNLLLSHHELCKPTGEVRRVKGNIRLPTGKPIYPTDGNAVKWNQNSVMDSTLRGHADPDGTEPQEVWECVAGCPVRLLGEPARFFPCFENEAPFRYVAKASRRERNAGLEGMPQRNGGCMEGNVDQLNARKIGARPDKPVASTLNNHPTVKPIALMRWLVRLVTPPGGTVLDPFMGSGSTGCAAVQEGFDFIGIEMDEEYVEIARRRIAYWSTPEYLRPKTQTKANPIQGCRFGEAGARKVPRCPRHDETFLSGETTYKCGCKFEWTNEPKVPDSTDPTFTGRLF